MVRLGVKLPADEANKLSEEEIERRYFEDRDEAYKRSHTAASDFTIKQAPGKKLLDLNDERNAGIRELILSFKPLDKLRVETMVKNGELKKEDV